MVWTLFWTSATTCILGKFGFPTEYMELGQFLTCVSNIPVKIFCKTIWNKNNLNLLSHNFHQPVWMVGKETYQIQQPPYFHQTAPSSHWRRASWVKMRRGVEQCHQHPQQGAFLQGHLGLALAGVAWEQSISHREKYRRSVWLRTGSGTEHCICRRQQQRTSCWSQPCLWGRAGEVQQVEVGLGHGSHDHVHREHRDLGHGYGMMDHRLWRVWMALDPGLGMVHSPHLHCPILVGSRCKYLNDLCVKIKIFFTPHAVIGVHIIVIARD